MNNKGSIKIVLLVFIIVLAGTLILLKYTISGRYNNADMFKRFRSMYLAESALDIQKHLLLNKIENTKIYLIYETRGGESSLKNSTMLFDVSVLDVGFTDIDAEVSNFLRGSKGMVSIRGALETELKLETPNSPEKLKIDYLCSDPKFWSEDLGDKQSYEDYICKMDDLKFSSKVKFLGGEYLEVFTIKGLELIREPFEDLDEGGVGEAEAMILTENMKIEVNTFQSIKGVNYGK